MLISAGFKFMPYAAYLSSITNLASGVHKFAAVYAGTPPTKAQILAATDAATGNIKWDSLRSVMTDRVLLAYVNTAKPLIAVRDANDAARIPLAALDTPAVVVANGTPTWYIYGHLVQGAFSGTDTPETITSVQMGNCVVGSVGDENSSADVQIVGGTISTTNGYTFMDLPLKF